ncbi:hypothetical protein HanHA89_Chr02g0055471 [Helianthus annuus]|nr:hypothetical protein HanHA89_Chr02g0055471 [Helianthus annuus]
MATVKDSGDGMEVKINDCIEKQDVKIDEEDSGTQGAKVGAKQKSLAWNKRRGEVMGEAVAWNIAQGFQVEKV